MCFSTWTWEVGQLDKLSPASVGLTTMCWSKPPTRSLWRDFFGTPFATNLSLPFAPPSYIIAHVFFSKSTKWHGNFQPQHVQASILKIILSMGVPTIAFLMSSDRPDLTRLLFQAGPGKLKKCVCVYIHKYIERYRVFFINSSICLLILFFYLVIYL